MTAWEFSVPARRCALSIFFSLYSSLVELAAPLHVSHPPALQRRGLWLRSGQKRCPAPAIPSRGRRSLKRPVVLLPKPCAASLVLPCTGDLPRATAWSTSARPAAGKESNSYTTSANLRTAHLPRRKRTRQGGNARYQALSATPRGRRSSSSTASEARSASGFFMGTSTTTCRSRSWTTCAGSCASALR